MIKKTLNRLLRRLDISVNRYSRLQDMRERLLRYDSDFRDLDFLRALPGERALGALEELGRSRSQFRQDLFVLAELNHKEHGFFVEFGAGNGVEFSNTYLLENDYGWHGILAEPAKAWHEDLFRNRRAHIDVRCVWSSTGASVDFTETREPLYSTATPYLGGDLHARTRQRGRTYTVETVSLEDLLREHEAPRHIDYLSIDTEGSEYDVLKGFNFASYEFAIITCEHNFTANRERIRALLESHGYRRKLAHVSCNDDWYVRTGSG